MSFAAETRDWRKLVSDTWPAVTACDLLYGKPDVWAAEGLTAPSEEEAVALAAAGRLFRFGQSVAVHLPVSRNRALAHMAFYLHRLRLDAAQGLVRAPWLNRVEMAQRFDLLVFGRPRAMLRDFATSTVMRPAIVKVNAALEVAEFQRTLLIDGNGDLLSTLELLNRVSRPFAIVLDVSAQGCGERSSILAKELPAYFDRVPIVAVGHTGQALEALEGIHRWSVRLGDGAPLTATHQPPSAMHVGVLAARDQVMNGFVKRLGYLVWHLKRILEETQGRSLELSALLTVERGLRSLNVPLAVHEQFTARFAHGGLFAVRTLESWIEIASRLRGRRGDIEMLIEEVRSLIRGNLPQLGAALHGRSELILELARQAMKSCRRQAILVGNKRDAAILQTWLEEQLGADAVNWIAVSSMDGASAEPPDRPDQVVYAAPMYPSRLHWLGLFAKEKVVLCHPFERERICQQIDRWWRSHALSSSRDGDKYRLWSLNWGSAGVLSDLLVEGGADQEGFVTYDERPLDGVYPQPLRVAEVETSRGYEDWLQALLAEPEHHETHVDERVVATEQSDMVIIHVDGHAQPLRWPAGRQIMRFEADTFAACPASDLVVGNDLVLLGNSDDRIATQRDLFDMFVENNHGLRQTLRVAEKWQEFVALSVGKLGSVARVTRHLRSNKYEISQSAVQNWHAGGVIGPEKPAAILILAELAGVAEANKMARMVENAIVAIRTEHRKIGSDLRKAIMLTRSRDVFAVNIGSRRFSREVFDAMVEVCRIVAIQHPAHTPPTAQRAKNVRDLARAFAANHSDKVVFTSACERSMANSAFEDLDAFKEVLEVLVNGFYPMYASKSVSLEQVQGMLAKIPASYAGRMSEVTKGKFESDYVRLYEGQKVDISRHVKLGKAFDQRHTLRLHFHWDERVAKIVVHHSGAHLPTLNN